MTTTQAMEGASRLQAPSTLTRVTRVALLLNALMATVATTGFIAGFVPHAAEEPIMARRAAAGEFAGVFIFVFVARSVRRNPSLIALPVAFVLFQVADSVYELLRSGNTNDLPPLVVEAIFLSIYAVYAATQLRARRVAPAV